MVSLFRREALEHPAGRLHGDIRLGLPFSWQVIGYVLFSALLVAAAFLVAAPYARTEVVRGSVVLDRGIASIMTTRPGVIAALRVTEGQPVDAGTSLAVIRAEETLAAGGSAPQKVLKAVEAQDAGLARQSQETATAAEAEQARLGARMAGLTQQLASLGRQIQGQRDLVASGVRELDVIQDVVRKGFISRREVILREETVLTRRQQLNQLLQARSAKQADLAEARRSVAEARAQAEAQIANLLSSRAALGQRRAEAQAAQGYVLTSPVTGTVTALTARRGQAVGSDEPLMMIVPAGTVPKVELHVPTRAAGFLRRGQEIRLAVDAFPYERFGTVGARISEISITTVAREDQEGKAAPVYLVTAEIPRPWVWAFGRRQELVSGMTLTARIVTERQSLLRWLFEPVLAVRGR
jgi:membrane fusion protein